MVARKLCGARAEEGLKPSVALDYDILLGVGGHRVLQFFMGFQRIQATPFLHIISTC